MNDLEHIKFAAYQRGFTKRAAGLKAMLQFGGGVGRMSKLQTLAQSLRNIPRILSPGRHLRGTTARVGDAIGLTRATHASRINPNAARALQEFHKLKSTGTGYDPRLMAQLQQTGMMGQSGAKGITTTGSKAVANAKKTSGGMTDPHVANPYMVDEAAILSKGGIPNADHAFGAHMGRVLKARQAAAEAAKREAEISNAVFSAGESSLRPAGLGGMTRRGITSGGGLTYL